MVSRQTADFVWLLLLGVLLVVLCAWLTGNNFNSEVALRDWVKVIGVLDADEFRLEHLGLNTPHLPLYLLMPFAWLLENSLGIVPYLLSSLLIALLLTIWNHQLRHTELVLWQRTLLLMLILLQVPLLWAATTGGHIALTLLVFYFVCQACLRMNFQADLRSFIMLGLSLGLLFFVDAMALFIFIALFPFFAVIAPQRIFREAPLSMYIVIAIPLGVAVITWGYLGWIFEGRVSNFIYQPGSTFLGAWQHAADSPWLIRYGGQWFASLGAAFMLLLVYFPVVFLLLGLVAKRKNHLKISLTLILVPLIAITFATSKFYLERPIDMLALVIVGIMVQLSIIQIRKGWKFSAVVLLLVAGGVSGWYNFLQMSDPAVHDWRKALFASLDNTHAADIALGQFLSRHRGETLIDDFTAYRVIAARGDAENIALPRSDLFKLQVRRQVPDITYIVVPDPRVGQGGWDRINKHFPDLYASGMKNYQQVYDNQGWRVFKHVTDR
ncbi:MAG: hypothetical protein L3J70_05190 [Gammaproteobacteria bacterium]|nr:hypothetical protein [Gammaproteobacteria bacterium]